MSGDEIEDLLHERGVTKSAIAAEHGVHLTTVTRTIHRQFRRPNRVLTEAIAAAIGVPVDEAFPKRRRRRRRAA